MAVSLFDEDPVEEKINEYLRLVEDWEDPNPAPVIEVHDGIHVVRDDLLPAGSKARFIDKLVRDDPTDEWVFGSAPKTGWGPISLAYVCSKYGKKATFFMAKRAVPTPQQLKCMEFGGNIVWVDNGMLNVTQSKAKVYAGESKNRKVLPIGLEHPTVFGSMIKVMRSMNIDPGAIWSVGSGGCLNRGMQMAWPNALAHVVQVGHNMSEREIGKAVHSIAEYKWDQAVKGTDIPPFPSAAEYDAKGWKFVVNQHEPILMNLFWNVAGNA